MSTEVWLGRQCRVARFDELEHPDPRHLSTWPISRAFDALELTATDPGAAKATLTGPHISQLCTNSADRVRRHTFQYDGSSSFGLGKGLICCMALTLFLVYRRVTVISE